MSLATPKRIFARHPRRSRWRVAIGAGALLAVMIIGAGGGALLGANLRADQPAMRQASSLH